MNTVATEHAADGRPADVLAWARHYTRRGWSVVPIPYREKNPGFRGWQRLRLDQSQLDRHFNDHPQNIGVLLGEPSGWLIDVDLDHPRCVELADEYLPATPLLFGRSGKPRSHRIYVATAPLTTVKHKSKSAGMLAEIRSTGAQTVFPPGTHVSGETIEWVDFDVEPLRIDPTELRESVKRLASAVRLELGEVTPRTLPRRKARVADAGSDKFAACVRAMMALNMADNNDGSGRLFAAACRTVEHDLSDADAIGAIREYARQRPFPTDWTDDQILNRIRDAESKTRRGVISRVVASDDKPKILIGPDEHRVADETVAALAQDPNLYQRGGLLVHTIRHDGPADDVSRGSNPSTITALPTAGLRERMTRYATFTRLVRQGDEQVEVPAHPTQWLVGAVDARGRWPGIRQLMGLSDVPVLRPDGSVCQAPGYDAATGVLYEPAGSIPAIPDDPTVDDAWAAVSALLEVVADFPFEGEDHKAAWIAALLTPLARFAFDGPAPFFLIDANVRGAGKSLLVLVIGWIVLGREMPVSSYTHDADELRKKITAIALAGDRVVHLDNIDGSFGNGCLDSALTTTRWSDRVLGKSQQIDLPLLPVWYGTGNNVSVAADTMRRIVHIRLDVLSERPEHRTGFRHPDLLGWVKANRRQLVAHALTILGAYCRAGQPEQHLTPFGSFENWSRLVRSAVVWAGLSDPCRTSVQLAAFSDTSADALGQLLLAWQAFDSANEGVVVSQTLSRLYRKDLQPSDDASAAMRAALENLVGCPPGRVPTARQVGNRLKHFRRRVVRNLYLDTNPAEQSRNGAVWRVFSAGATV